MLSTIKNIWLVLQLPERRKALVLLTAQLFCVLLEILSVSLVFPVVAVLASTGAESSLISWVRLTTGVTAENDLLFVLVSLLLLVYTIKTSVSLANAWFQTRFTFQVAAGVSRRLLETYLNLSVERHISQNSAVMRRNVLMETNIFSQATAASVLLISEVFVVCFLMLLVLLIQPIPALLGISIGLISYLGYRIFYHDRISIWGRERHSADNKRLQTAEQALGSIIEVKLWKIEKFFLEMFDQANQKNANSQQRLAFFRETPRMFLEWSAILFMAGLVFYGTLTGSVRELIPVVGLFIAIAFRLLPSFSRIISSIGVLGFAQKAVLTIVTELREERVVDSKGSAELADSGIVFEREITVDSVSFKYPNSSSYSLRNVNLVIRRGEVIGIVGQSGSGKSTLVKVLLGLLSPTEGFVRVDGQDIQEVLPEWQRRVGYVAQQSYLIDDQIKINIIFGRKDIGDQWLNRVIQQADLVGMINDLPDKERSSVGERGGALSGGQMQRVAIARALYGSPEILFLDESTSALDNETEQKILRVLKNLKGLVTIVLITHRPNALGICDKVYEVSAGRVEVNSYEIEHNACPVADN